MIIGSLLTWDFSIQISFYLGSKPFLQSVKVVPREKKSGRQYPWTWQRNLSYILKKFKFKIKKKTWVICRSLVSKRRQSPNPRRDPGSWDVKLCGWLCYLPDRIRHRPGSHAKHFGSSHPEPPLPSDVERMIVIEPQLRTCSLVFSSSVSRLIAKLRAEVYSWKRGRSARALGV